MDSGTPPTLLSLPPEILSHTLALASPRDCARFSQSNTAAHSLCHAPSLWRALHRARWDPAVLVEGGGTTDSAPSSSSSSYDYAAQVHRRTRTQTLLTAAAHPDEPKPVPPAEYELVLSTLVDIALSRSPVSQHGPEASPSSRNEAFLARHLPPDSPVLLSLHPSFSPRSSTRTLRSSSKSPAPSPSPSDLASQFHLAQLASHLSVLSSPSPLLLASPSILTAAREIVYEKSNFTRAGAWGPFMSDGSGEVDWRKVEAVAIVMASELGEAVGEGWGVEGQREGDETRVPLGGGWGVSRPGSAMGGAEEGGRDWAGIDGKEWRGTYAFLHWPNWYHFNFHRPSAHSLHHTPAALLPPPNTLASDPSSLGDPMALHFSLLPEGEWPREVDVEDLSREGLEEAVERGEEEEGAGRDGDWGAGGGGGAGSDGSESGSSEEWSADEEEEEEEDEDEGEEGDVDLEAFLRDTGRGASTSHSHHPSSPPTSPPAPSSATLPVPFGYPGPLSPPPPPSSSSAAAAAAEGRGMQLTFAPPPPSSRSSSSASSSAEVEANDPDPDPFPPLAFTGTTRPTSSPPPSSSSSSAGPPSRTIRGVLSLTPPSLSSGSSGSSPSTSTPQAIRFQALIAYSGHDQWALSGVVVSRGGRQGVLGIWTGAERSEEGPCGPFWYWPHCPEDEDAAATV
ncbi:hypothetical protein JCM6882_005971 [Rhodosporidiobolus microsporus]